MSQLSGVFPAAGTLHKTRIACHPNSTDALFIWVIKSPFDGTLPLRRIRAMVIAIVVAFRGLALDIGL